MSVPGTGRESPPLPPSPHHDRHASTLSIGSDCQAGAADNKTNEAFTQVRRSVDETSRAVRSQHRDSAVAPVVLQSSQPQITFQLQNSGWNQACEVYFQGQGIEIEQGDIDGSREDLCCRLLEVAISKQKLTPFLVVPIPPEKIENLVAFLDAFIDADPECEIYKNMKTALTAAEMAKSKLNQVFG